MEQRKGNERGIQEWETDIHGDTGRLPQWLSIPAPSSSVPAFTCPLPDQYLKNWHHCPPYPKFVFSVQQLDTPPTPMVVPCLRPHVKTTAPQSPLSLPLLASWAHFRVEALSEDSCCSLLLFLHEPTLARPTLHSYLVSIPTLSHLPIFNKCLPCSPPLMRCHDGRKASSSRQHSWSFMALLTMYLNR